MNDKYRTAEFKELVGETLSSVEGKVGDEEIIFTTKSGRKFKLYHIQDCCESVLVNDICGDWADLLSLPIVQAEEITETPFYPHSDWRPESFTWTFYKISTRKGTVTIRWWGESNGYYSESVDFEEDKGQ